MQFLKLFYEEFMKRLRDHDRKAFQEAIKILAKGMSRKKQIKRFPGSGENTLLIQKGDIYLLSMKVFTGIYGQHI